MIAGKRVKPSEMLLSLVRRVSADLDVEKIREDVEAFSRRHPELTTRRKAELIVSRAARKAAVIGAAASLPPGWLALATMGPELTALIVLESRMIVGIHLLYGGSPDAAERAGEVLVGLAAGAGLSASRRFATRASEEIAERLVVRAAGRGVAHLVPLLGAAGAAGINWLAVNTIGRAVIERVAGRYGPPEVPGRGPILDVKGTSA